MILRNILKNFNRTNWKQLNTNNYYRKILRTENVDAMWEVSTKIKKKWKSSECTWEDWYRISRLFIAIWIFQFFSSKMPSQNYNGAHTESCIINLNESFIESFEIFRKLEIFVLTVKSAQKHKFLKNHKSSWKDSYIIIRKKI